MGQNHTQIHTHTHTHTHTHMRTPNEHTGPMMGQNQMMQQAWAEKMRMHEAAMHQVDVFVCICIYIFTHIYVYTNICIYVFMYI